MSSLEDVREKYSEEFAIKTDISNQIKGTHHSNFSLGTDSRKFRSIANLSKGKQQPNTKLEMVSDISFGFLRKKRCQGHHNRVLPTNGGLEPLDN